MIAEISGTQWVRMSKAEQRRYRTHREEERLRWTHACREYYATVRQSYEIGIPLVSMHPDARAYIHALLSRQEQAQRKQEEAAYYHNLFLHSASDAMVGMKIRHNITSGIISRVTAKSVQVVWPDGSKTSFGPNMLAAGALRKETPPCQ